MEAFKPWLHYTIYLSITAQAFRMPYAIIGAKVRYLRGNVSGSKQIYKTIREWQCKR